MYRGLLTLSLCFWFVCTVYGKDSDAEVDGLRLATRDVLAQALERYDADPKLAALVTGKYPGVRQMIYKELRQIDGAPIGKGEWCGKIAEYNNNYVEMPAYVDMTDENTRLEGIRICDPFFAQEKNEKLSMLIHELVHFLGTRSDETADAVAISAMFLAGLLPLSTRYIGTYTNLSRLYYDLYVHIASPSMITKSNLPITISLSNKLQDLIKLRDYSVSITQNARWPLAPKMICKFLRNGSGNPVFADNNNYEIGNVSYHSSCRFIDNGGRCDNDTPYGDIVSSLIVSNKDSLYISCQTFAPLPISQKMIKDLMENFKEVVVQ